jgi:hypothetical protein
MTGACGTRRRGGRENAPLIWQCERWKDDQRLYRLTAPQSSSASRFTARASGFFILSQIGRAIGAVGRVLPLRNDVF